jgi:hypothetical protein
MNPATIFAVNAALRERAHYNGATADELRLALAAATKELAAGRSTATAIAVGYGRLRGFQQARGGAA